MPVIPVPNADALAMAAAWRKAHPKPVKKPRIDVPATINPPVIHPETPKPSGETPAECQKCPVASECKTILKMWYRHAPRPELVRAWENLIGTHRIEMVCMPAEDPAGIQRISLRRDK